MCSTELDFEAFQDIASSRKHLIHYVLKCFCFVASVTDVPVCVVAKDSSFISLISTCSELLTAVMSRVGRGGVLMLCFHHLAAPEEGLCVGKVSLCGSDTLCNQTGTEAVCQCRPGFRRNPRNRQCEGTAMRSHLLQTDQTSKTAEDNGKNRGRTTLQDRWKSQGQVAKCQIGRNLKS